MRRYDFFSIATKSWDKYSKKLIDTATKKGIDAAKNCRSYRSVSWKRKTAKKITSVGKTKSKEKDDKIDKRKEFAYHQK